MNLSRCQIRISADNSRWRWKDAPMWVGRAEVRGLLDDGRPVHYEWTFGGNPRKSREEAERFAYEAMLDRLRGKRGRFD